MNGEELLLKHCRDGTIDSVRFSFADQHGLLRGKTLAPAEVEGALRNGIAMTSTILAKDTSHRTAFPVFGRETGGSVFGLRGAADIVLRPDASTYRLLPWVPRTGWVQCEAEYPNGTSMPFDTRAILRKAVRQLAERGLGFICGLEVEFHLFALSDARMDCADAGQPGEPPEVRLLSKGYQYLTEQRYDQLEPAIAVLRSQLEGLNLPLRSFEVEFGPSQVEFTFAPMEALEAADAMVLFRSAVKQIARRNGYHATFMCRPRIPNAMSSGWHLHQSLRDRQGKNAFAATNGEPRLSDDGMHWLAGLLRHAKGYAAFAAPTINAYKRYRPHSLAPDRILWGFDNRAAMLRVIHDDGGSGARIENRIGEPAANPYLYLASQIHAGLIGLEEQLDPGPASDNPYETAATSLPATLGEAVDAMQADEKFVARFGAEFVAYFAHIKRSEIARFNLEVSEWEHKEYFDVF